MEMAASWEDAAARPSGLPERLEALFNAGEFRDPVLMVGIAEHKVPLAGRGGDSQCDLWGLLNTTEGIVSMSVEAKASEPFGGGNEPLEAWLNAGTSTNSPANRWTRWEHVIANLPAPEEGGYDHIPFQLLHRCAAAVIEARRWRVKNAAFVVQGFNCPQESFDRFAEMARVMGVPGIERGTMGMTMVADIRLGISWADCELATDRQLALVV